MEARRAPFVRAQSTTRLWLAHQSEEGRLQPRIQPHDDRVGKGCGIMLAAVVGTMIAIVTLIMNVRLTTNFGRCARRSQNLRTNVKPIEMTTAMTGPIQFGNVAITAGKQNGRCERRPLHFRCKNF